LFKWIPCGGRSVKVNRPPAEKERMPGQKTEHLPALVYGRNPARLPGDLVKELALSKK
jgi:hypothetical protein